MAQVPGALGWILVAAVTVLGFGLLVVIHELGHFAAARLCGMRVERFSVGYGPVLWSLLVLARWADRYLVTRANQSLSPPSADHAPATRS